MEVLKDNHNELLRRREINIVVSMDKNPSFTEAEDIIVKEFKTDKENVVIKGISGKFGRKTFLIKAFIYDNKETKEEIEPKSKKKKGEEGETAPAPVAEAPKEEKKEESKPEEEKKEEAKQEEEKKA